MIGFYVSAIDGKRRAPMLGPFATHAEALGMVDTARHRAYDLDMRSHWWYWGTCRVETKAELPKGSMNRYIPIPVINQGQKTLF